MIFATIVQSGLGSLQVKVAHLGNISEVESSIITPEIASVIRSLEILIF
mgnify:CR=1 FL=1